jgi:hypothetical protein
MRSLIVAAALLPMLIGVASAQRSSFSPAAGDRAAAVRRENADLEKARLIEQLRHSNLRMQARQKELEDLARQAGEPMPPQTPSLQTVEQQHPEWFRETNKYRPCPWNMCPPPQ